MRILWEPILGKGNKGGKLLHALRLICCGWLERHHFSQFIAGFNSLGNVDLATCVPSQGSDKVAQAPSQGF
jgi:hypothetical protein